MKLWIYIHGAEMLNPNEFRDCPCNINFFLCLVKKMKSIDFKNKCLTN